MALHAPDPDGSPPALERTPLIFHVRPTINLAGAQFFELCQLNRELRLERTAQGDIVIAPPAGGATGARNLRLTRRLGEWADGDGSGIAFDSSTGFELPNGAMRSPDAAWVTRSRLAQLTPEQKDKFLPLCPDFVVELLSPTDSLAITREKMEEYVANGAQLGWLIDPAQHRVHVFRPGMPLQILEQPTEVGAYPVLPGFVLQLANLWDAGF
jgi:Uma2 family endonuclease